MSYEYRNNKQGIYIFFRRAYWRRFRSCQVTATFEEELKCDGTEEKESGSSI